MTLRERKLAAKVLRAMGHPVRLGVLDCLRHGPMTVTALHERLGCSQSLMSQQLQKLEYHGLIGSHREGALKFCSLRNRDVLNMMECLKKHLRLYLAGGSFGPQISEREKELAE